MPPPPPRVGGGDPPFVDPNPAGRWVGLSAAGVPREEEGSVGTPKYISQNDPHDVLVILNIHKWGNKNLLNKFAHQLRLPSAKVRPRGWVEGHKFFYVFHPF